MAKMNEQELERDYELIALTIRKCLEQFGYTFLKREFPNLTPSPMLCDTFVKGSNRTITIWVTENLGINATIHQEYNVKHFGLGDFLKKKTGQIHRTLTQRLPNESWDDFASRCADIVLDLFKNELHDVISGSQWIDIPFDWAIAGRE